MDDKERAALLNAEQLAELRQAFNECDGNGDNFISTKELGWAMRVMGFDPTELELQQLVNRVKQSQLLHQLSHSFSMIQMVPVKLNFLNSAT